LHFKCSNIESIVTHHHNRNNVDICHRFHYEAAEYTYVSHIYYSVQTEEITNETATIVNANASLFNLNAEHVQTSPDSDAQVLWFFAVFIVITLIILAFVGVFVYLIRDGVFNENKQPKRKKSTVSIVDNRPSGTRHSLPNSPKNLRINVTYHKPVENANDKREESLQITSSRPLTGLVEGNEDDDDEDEDEARDELSELNNAITPLFELSSRHAMNDSAATIEESIIQYIINSQQRGNDVEAASPIPFCSA